MNTLSNPMQAYRALQQMHRHRQREELARDVVGGQRTHRVQ
jgi:hypothetical protein